jgi:hypothetical protein
MNWLIYQLVKRGDRPKRESKQGGKLILPVDCHGRFDSFDTEAEP